MKIGIFGNCQAGAIARILKEHLPEHDIIAFKAIHTMSYDDKMNFLNKLKDLDILLHQPVSDVYAPISTDKILSMIDNKKSILIPVMYFSPYFMDITYLKNEKGQTDRTFISDYHSRIILSSFYHGLNKYDIYKAFKRKDFFPEKLVLENLHTSLNVLKEREKTCDIKISNYISENYSNKNLFFTFNHPTGHLLYFVVNEFLSIINKPKLSEIIKHKHSRALGGVHWMTNTSVKETLKLNFKDTNDFYINGKIYTLDNFIEISNEFYKNNLSLIELNKSRILPINSFN